MIPYINVLKEEHKNILKELDKLEKKTNTAKNEKTVLNIIEKFIKNNSKYIMNHLTKEELFYEYINKELGNKADLKELAKSKEVITKEVTTLNQINKSCELSKSKLLINNFIEGIKNRISFEEQTLFKIADYIPEKEPFE
ncbi:hemerythrin domain-containing protein [Candidatus Woesearchaeota archaeon]|nr:hemerythrin domain-containing protein [Candidatus Woesearchaeota archaeon]